MLTALLAALVLCGCGTKKDARATPSELARQSLETALTAWQNGKTATDIQGASPPLQVVDSVWARGRPLQGFEIVSEETNADGLRCFSVRLNLGSPRANEVARYVVKGRSPVWIYRQEDHERSRSWGASK
jgi:hypothetical protein